MSPELAFTIVSAFAIFFVGIVVYFHDRKSATNALFFFISLATLLWSVANYFSLVTPPTEAINWVRLVLFFATPHAVLFLLFTYNFPQRNLEIKKTIFWPVITVMTITMIFTLTPLIFADTQIINNQVIPIPGPLIPMFVVVVVGSLLGGVYISIKKYHKADKAEKRRWQFLLTGFIVSYFLLIMTNFVLVVFFENTNINIYGPLFMIPTIIGMAYAIVKHKLLNVKAVATEMLIFAILFISMFEIFVSQGLLEILIRIAGFLFLFVFSIFLIRSVLKEVEQREQLEKLSQELYKANAKLKELDQLKTEFLSITSHQLRTPLSGIKGYLSMMIDGDFGKFSDEQGTILNRVKSEVDRLVRLVQDFLNVSRIESGRLQIAMLEFDLIGVIKTVIKELEPAAEAANLKLSYKTDLDALTVIGDPDKIKDVVVNLTDNAIKYTQAGKIWIEAKLVDNNHSVQIEVHDTGVGVDADEIGKLFSKFQRARGIAKVSPSGSGLGLFIARKIISGHKGDIWAESKGKGKGAAFIFKIPITQHSTDS